MTPNTNVTIVCEHFPAIIKISVKHANAVQVPDGFVAQGAQAHSPTLRPWGSIAQYATTTKIRPIKRVLCSIIATAAYSFARV